MFSHKKKKRVFVGVSGGVDSSVSAALLKEQGYEVIAVFIRTWQPDWLPCSWKKERRDAMRVSANLEIPFFELNLEEEYKRGVVDYMLSEYRKGKVPNPDVMCNREIKFGAFLRWALEHGGDFVATGHYARVEKRDGVYRLLRGKDRKKDQSYFLWSLREDDLRHIIFPIGQFEKTEVRKLAKKFSLKTYSKPDSQGICFLGDVDMKDFLKHYIEEKEGDVLDEDGNVIGRHPGSYFFTLGERHGFLVEKKNTSGGPYYVIAKDLERNTITVSQNPGNVAEKRNSGEIVLEDVNDIYSEFYPGMEVSFQIRYRGSLHYGRVKEISPDRKFMKLIPHSWDYTINPGQSIVFYDDDLCRGGAVVKECSALEKNHLC